MASLELWHKGIYGEEGVFGEVTFSRLLITCFVVSPYFTKVVNTWKLSSPGIKCA